MVPIAPIVRDRVAVSLYEPPARRTLRVTLVQPSIPQTLIWDTSRDKDRFRELIQLSEQALSNCPNP